MSVAEKLTTIAQNQQKVFDAGKSEGINQLEELQKGSANGEVISITDISPVEHTVGIKLSSDTITDFSTVTLKAQGKNLINFFDITAQQDITYVTAQGVERTTKGYVIDNLIAGKSYTISFDFKDSANISEYVYSFMRDKTTLKIVSSASLTTTRIEKNPYTFVAQENCDYIIYRGGTYTITQSEINKFSSFQCELGGSTPYEPYIEPTSYKPMADGTVEGVKNIYPNMTLMTDKQGVLIEVGYKKDMNLVFDEYVKGEAD